MSNEISVEELKTKLDKKENLTIVDVREDAEWDYSHIDGAIHHPMSLLQEEKFGPLTKDQHLVLYCKAGGRSLRSTLFLKSKGFNHVVSLKGGLTEWANKIDPNMDVF